MGAALADMLEKLFLIPPPPPKPPLKLPPLLYCTVLIELMAAVVYEGMRTGQRKSRRRQRDPEQVSSLEER